MASSDGHDTQPTSGDRVPGGRSTWRVSLDDLAVWCADVLRRAVDGVADAGPAVHSGPPLPWHLRAPLRRHGFDGFDEVAIALTLAPDLEPVLGVARSE